MADPNATNDYFAGRAEQFIDRARNRRGLENVGTGFEEGYAQFLSALDRDVEFDAAGRERTEGFIQGLFESRLVAQENLRRNPAYQEVDIRRPIIITGIPRSGTTALHKLMSIDPQFQGIEYWLANAPKPRPDSGAWASDPDYRMWSEILAAMIAASPEIFSEHGMHVDDVDESYLVLQQTFSNNTFPSLWDIPSYDRWYRDYDETPGYRYLADVMRLVGLAARNRTWLLKNPADTYALDAVLNTFPDARVIQTHRDPVDALPSVVHLIGASRWTLSSPDVDLRRLMLREVDFWAAAMQRARTARSRLQRPAIDVEFAAFVRDQMGTVRRIYDALELRLTPEVEAQMQKWLALHPRREGALQRHAAETYGMSAGRIREVCADYRGLRGYD